ncbi:hypothetical protein [Streptomyces parvus]|uniref:hypothetical protein n=1 Tax=Streptomyces parvus TaxID=66428 RepID=UPI0016537D1E|nr:hypothetical protein [Streptomyces parvus]
MQGRPAEDELLPVEQIGDGGHVVQRAELLGLHMGDDPVPVVSTCPVRASWMEGRCSSHPSYI